MPHERSPIRHIWLTEQHELYSHCLFNLFYILPSKLSLLLLFCPKKYFSFVGDLWNTRQPFWAQLLNTVTLIPPLDLFGLEYLNPEIAFQKAFLFLPTVCAGCLQVGKSSIFTVLVNSEYP